MADRRASDSVLAGRVPGERASAPARLRAVSAGDGRPEALRVLARADRELFARLASRHDPVLDRIMPAVSHAADHGVLWMAVATRLATGGPASRRAAVRGMASLAVASASVNILAKLTVRRTRPPLERVPVARRVLRTPVTTSFPSGHSASAAAFTVGAAREAPEVAVPLGVMAAAVGFSRVWTGAHYPGDVLVGAAVGATVARLLPSVRPRRGP
jgi:membrane-associated phospholipid phosphatase